MLKPNVIDEPNPIGKTPAPVRANGARPRLVAKDTAGVGAQLLQEPPTLTSLMLTKSAAASTDSPFKLTDTIDSRRSRQSAKSSLFGMNPLRGFQRSASCSDEESDSGDTVEATSSSSVTASPHTPCRPIASVVSQFDDMESADCVEVIYENATLKGKKQSRQHRRTLSPVGIFATVASAVSRKPAAVSQPTTPLSSATIVTTDSNSASPSSRGASPSPESSNIILIMPNINNASPLRSPTARISGSGTSTLNSPDSTTKYQRRGRFLVWPVQLHDPVLSEESHTNMAFSGPMMQNVGVGHE
jgi:hypothetical protein